jgi:glycosyltransferase involved in cell wall biosynthesis
MKLAFITNLYPPYIVGGYEMTCDAVVGALRARGHEVHVLTGQGRDLPSRPDVVSALDLDLERKDERFLRQRVPTAAEAFRWHVYSAESRRGVERHLARIRPDVVAVWSLYLASLGPLVAARRCGAPVVAHLCDKWLALYLRDVGPVLDMPALSRQAVRLAQRSVRGWLRRAAMPHRLLAVSEFLRRFYLDAGFDPATLDVAHLGVAVADFAGREKTATEAGGLLRLLYVGSLWEGKGLATALRALGRLHRDGLAAWHLDVCGSGTQGFQAHLDRIVAEEGLGGRVTFHGFVDRAVVRDFCRSHDVLVFPSEWDEPFAAVPLEGMSAGMAVVATTAGGTSEAITDGATGLLVAPKDPEAMARALRRLVDDPGLRLRLGAAAARVAGERFSLERYADRLESCYAQILRDRGLA